MQALTFIAPPLKRTTELRPVTFSVVIPAYQAAETVADAVTSALEQTHPPEEVIVVDDGSTDDIAGALARFGSQIRLIRKRNGGAASALNARARSPNAAARRGDRRRHGRGRRADRTHAVELGSRAWLHDALGGSGKPG
jgi:glycosyltransferase involved in cell wall biosynthesis